MEAHELSSETPVVPLARLRALQATLDSTAAARDRLSAALVVSEMEAEELRQERDQLSATRNELRDRLIRGADKYAQVCQDRGRLSQERDELRDAMAALETVAARLGAEVRDLTLQRDQASQMARKIKACTSVEHDTWIYADSIIVYSEHMTPAERARDAEERAGHQAADEAGLTRTGY